MNQHSRLPALPNGAVPLIKAILNGGHGTGRRDFDAIWQLAWAQRWTSLMSFAPPWRRLIVLCREIDRPSSTPKSGVPHHKVCHDEDSWSVHNG
jgi:hypothetical protein